MRRSYLQIRQEFAATRQDRGWVTSFVRHGVLRLAWAELLLNVVILSIGVVLVHYLGTPQIFRDLAQSSILTPLIFGIGFMQSALLTWCLKNYYEVVTKFQVNLDRICNLMHSIVTELNATHQPSAQLSKVRRLHVFLVATVYASTARLCQTKESRITDPLMQLQTNVLPQANPNDVCSSSLRLDELALPEDIQAELAGNRLADPSNEMMQQARKLVTSFTDADTDTTNSRMWLERRVDTIVQDYAELTARIQTGIPRVFVQHLQVALLGIIGVVLGIIFWVQLEYWVLVAQPAVMFLFGGFYKIALAVRNPFDEQGYNWVLGKNFRYYQNQAAALLDSLLWQYEAKYNSQK